MDLILPPADDLERHAAPLRLQEPAGLIGVVLLPAALLGQLEWVTHCSINLELAAVPLRRGP